MEKTRKLFKKTGVIKGTHHTKMDVINNRSGKDLSRR